MKITHCTGFAVTYLVAGLSVAQTLAPVPLDGQVSRFPINAATVDVAAFTPVQVVVRTDRSHNPPVLVGATGQGSEIRASFFAEVRSVGFNPDPLNNPTPVTLPGLPPGTYKLLLGNSLAFSLPTSAYAETSTLNIVVSGLPASLVVTPMAFMPYTFPSGMVDDRNWYRPKHYLALGVNEPQALLALNPTIVNGALLPLWTLTEPAFRAWPNVPEAPAATVPVCRFFNPTVVTHFYSAKASDCALLAASSAWVNEGVAFRTLLPVNGVCPFATQPVYRLFSQTLSNHRYTQSAETYSALQLKGYAPEGVAFCSPNV
jgi:hypothetical protein